MSCFCVVEICEGIFYDFLFDTLSGLLCVYSEVVPRRVCSAMVQLPFNLSSVDGSSGADSSRCNLLSFSVLSLWLNIIFIAKGVYVLLHSHL